MSTMRPCRGTRLTQDDALTRALAKYREAFGSEPTHAAFAPGRVNLIGDHTDYALGLVFPAALEDGCVCVIGPREGGFGAVSSELDGTTEIALNGRLEPGELTGQPGWVRYAAGTFEAMRRRFAPGASGVNMAVASDVPPGSGLSSSAALEVSIATALESMWGLDLDPIEKAKACQHAEHVFTNTPCGLMDQLVSTLGQAGHAIRIDFGKNTRLAVPMPPSRTACFVIFDSAVRHANDDGGYASRRAACESALPKLGVGALGELGIDALESLPATLSPVEVDATTHVVTENERVRAFARCLTGMRLHEAGVLMTESHRSLSEVYRVSCPEVDTLVSILNEQPGVYGARMTGGGFGGWTVALIESDAIERVTDAVMDRYRDATGLESTFRVVRAGDGARVIDLEPLVISVRPDVTEDARR